MRPIEMISSRTAIVVTCLLCGVLVGSPPGSAERARPHHVLVVEVSADSGRFRLADPRGVVAVAKVGSDSEAVPAGWHLYSFRSSDHEIHDCADDEEPDFTSETARLPDGVVGWIVENPGTGPWRLEAMAEQGPLDSVLVWAVLHGDRSPDLDTCSTVLRGLKRGGRAVVSLRVTYGESAAGKEWGRLRIH